MVELVMVEQLDLQKTFPMLLSLSNRLGQHTNIIIMMAMDDTIQLSVPTFVRAHPQTKPWGIKVPVQCPLCGSTNSWSEKVGVMAPAQATVINYVYTCTFNIAKPPGFLVGVAKSKTSGWFQSPFTIFPPLPPVQSSPISPMSSITTAKCSSESVEITESTRKRAHN
ncbi:hypothetical protein DEU56DRAFT_755686 [Suillus clintonianus]|uniref:uncharacterized protein n=1 Tax=Suillus clintonianus TaxID=1904413 RepID=UPI001B86F6AD|nr:uncharacterized protein DEU56DRAFT_755686 [Suillus clintonianus]KAG2138968.1 hypothetical protein DEU56DRAFT_755686 [Suillus clintonianus]